MSGQRLPPERWVSAPVEADLPDAERARLRTHSRLGNALIALGLLGILWGVFHMLGTVGGPEQSGFANRQTYDEVKPLVQGALFGSLLRSFAGLGLCLLGGWLRSRTRESAA